MSSLYGRYRTSKFTDIWPTEINFRYELMDSELYDSDFSSGSITKLYYLLYAAYGNSHIASSDPNQFKYKVYSIIFSEGMKWQKSLEVQKKFEKLNDNEIRMSSKSVSSTGYNPGEGAVKEDPDGDDTLTYVNEQNKAKYIGGIIGSYSNYLDSLSDVTTQFIARFKPLFLTIVEPEKPLLYEMEGDDNYDY